MDHVVGVDTPFEDVIAWDEAGERITFDPEPGQFKELSEDELRRLSSFTKAVYSSMRAVRDQALRAEANPPIPGLKVETRYISPSDKLEVQYPPGFRDKWHTAWLRCDQDRQNRASGYVPVTDDDVEIATPGVGTGSSKIVGDYSFKEYTLMKLPKEEWEKRERVPSDVSRARMKGAEESVKDSLTRAGGQPFEADVDKPDPTHNWGPPKS